MARSRRALSEELSRRSVVKEVPLAELHIDRSYQREPSQNLVEKIAANYDEVASELILVSDRGTDENGGLYLVNGQHRSLAARKLNMDSVLARIIDLSKEEDPARIEAELRLKTNVGLPDRPLERFKAQVRAGDEDSLAIVKILSHFDTEINQRIDVNNGLNSVSTVEAIYNQDPTGALLVETMELIRDIFKSFSGRSVTSANLKGIAWFVEQHDKEIDRGRLVDKIRMLGTEALHRKAITMQSVMGGSLWMNYYRSIVEAYNDGLHVRNRLEFKLRGSGSFATRSKVGAASPWSSPGSMSGAGSHIG